MLIHDRVGIAVVHGLGEIFLAQFLVDCVFTGALTLIGVGNREEVLFDVGTFILLLDRLAVSGDAEVMDGLDRCVAVLVVEEDSARVGRIALVFRIGVGVDHEAISPAA